MFSLIKSWVAKVTKMAHPLHLELYNKYNYFINLKINKKAGFTSPSSDEFSNKKENKQTVYYEHEIK